MSWDTTSLVLQALFLGYVAVRAWRIRRTNGVLPAWSMTGAAIVAGVLAVALAVGLTAEAFGLLAE